MRKQDSLKEVVRGSNWALFGLILALLGVLMQLVSILARHWK